jgi:sulfatase maturation enzyme AslB (radical SAM superfamily)
MHNGETAEWPQDWQIDLGNYCNSACVFCSPYSSSKIATEFKRIGLIDAMPPTAWCNDRENLDKFIDVLKRSSKLVYLHFIGGETLITPAFKIILQSLIDSDLHQNISLGLTTNLTVWDQTIVDLLVQFKEVNLGLSIECVHELNDYVRYGGHLMQTMHIMEKWLEVARQNSWLTQLRITPTVLSIWHLDTIYEYAYNNSLSVESCNFITEPKYMRPSVLPADMRDQVKDKLKKWLSLHDAGSNINVINTRHPDMIHQQIVQDAQSYVHYLETESDESFRLPDLVRYLKTLEQSRGNSIIEYLPEYEQLLRTAGY